MSKSNFDRALAFVLRFEGGYADHPADPGGATNMGITRVALAAWRGQPVSKAEVRALKRAEAAAIYRARYWDAIRADDLPSGLDLALFDFAVNSGPSRAIRLLQRALGLEQDGRLGPVTLAAITSAQPARLLASLCTARRDFLKSLPTFPVFGRGWSARVDALETEARKLVQRISASPSSPAFSTRPKEIPMDMTKSILTSRTLWANTIGLFALGLSALGFNTSTLDTSALTESLFQAVAAGSFIVSSVFRVVATKRLS